MKYTFLFFVLGIGGFVYYMYEQRVETAEGRAALVELICTTNVMAVASSMVPDLRSLAEIEGEFSDEGELAVEEESVELSGGFSEFQTEFLPLGKIIQKNVAFDTLAHEQLEEISVNKLHVKESFRRSVVNSAMGECPEVTMDQAERIGRTVALTLVYFRKF